MSQPKQTTVTFINLFNLTRLCRTTLASIPHPGDQIYLGELGYEVARLSWVLAPSGLTDLDILLRPHPDASGQPILSYPEEGTLWQRWHGHASDSEEGNS